MEESIGKGCSCIYPFEKHYLELALDKVIQSQEEELQNYKRDVEAGRNDPATQRLASRMEGMFTMFESMISDYKTVRDRVKNMPDCGS